MSKILVQDIIDCYSLEKKGAPIEYITGFSSLDNQAIDKISWVKSEKFIDQVKGGVFVISNKINPPSIPSVCWLITEDSPKIVFSRILTKHFTKPVDYYLINCVDDHRKNPSIQIADGVFIGQNVSIGNNTILFPNCVIEADTVIGENCLIKANASVGTEGLGLQLDKTSNKLVKFPQLGNVVIEADVEIGPGTTVRRGALGSTRIMSGTKISAVVNIGHNSVIGKNCILAGGNVTSGSSILGDNCFMGVNSAVKNGVRVGNNVTIGMGAVVVKNSEDNVTLIGNPARIHKK